MLSDFLTRHPPTVGKALRYVGALGLAALWAAGVFVWAVLVLAMFLAASAAASLGAHMGVWLGKGGLPKSEKPERTVCG